MNNFLENMCQYELNIKDRNAENDFENVRLALRSLWFQYQPLYVNLFLKGKVIPISIFKEDPRASLLLDFLLEHEILERTIEFEIKIKSKYLIYFINNCFIITDFHNIFNVDRVFSIFHENVYLSSKLKIPSKGKVLDIGFGSGIFSVISALNGASEVFATDINPKAYKYAELNKVINGVEKNVHFIVGNVYDPLPKNIKFNLICSNPPFLPIPKNVPYYIHSNGGSRGTDIIETILKGLKNRIAPDGCFQMMVMSLGSYEEPLIGEKLNDILFKQKAAIEIKILQDPLSIEDFIKNLKRKIPGQFDEKEIKDWGIHAKMYGLTHLHYLYVEVNFGHHFSYKIERDYNQVDTIRSLLDKQFGFLNGIQWKDNNISKTHNNFWICSNFQF